MYIAVFIDVTIQELITMSSQLYSCFYPQVRCYASLGPTPKNRPGTHCLRMRIINTLNVGIPTFRYTCRVRPLRVTSRRITLRYVSVHYTCAMACLQPSGLDSALIALQRLGTPVLKLKHEQVAYIKCVYERRDVFCVATYRFRGVVVL